MGGGGAEREGGGGACLTTTTPEKLSGISFPAEKPVEVGMRGWGGEGGGIPSAITYNSVTVFNQ